jgi:hypothetical protein
LGTQIPKAQKDNQVTSVFFVHLESACIKAAHKTIMKLATDEVVYGKKEFVNNLERLLLQGELRP